MPCVKVERVSVMRVMIEEKEKDGLDFANRFAYLKHSHLLCPRRYREASACVLGSSRRLG